MAALELRGVEKCFAGGVRALHPLDLCVEDGELLVLVGPSGCGKSTALRLVAGLEAADAGQILLGGAPVDHLEPRERDVAMVFQSYALYPHMSVRRNIEFPLRMAGAAAAERRARAEAAAQTLGIEALLERKPGQLSGGQQQRVALARALVRRPRLFLFDEPLSNVDAKLRGEMRAELARLHRELGATMLYVTHDQVEAMTLGDRIAVLADGRLQQLGAPLEVYERPANRFVAGFLGAPPMNLLEGGGGAQLRPAGAPGDCTVGFRPHRALCGAAAGAGAHRARVDHVEALGNELLVHARCAGEPLVLALPGDAKLPASGDEILFAVPAGHLHLFAAGDGARLP
ncbi:MAG TPA: ABC transporter ATP-binding protein [Planctomycetota bacterium]